MLLVIHLYSSKSILFISRIKTGNDEKSVSASTLDRQTVPNVNYTFSKEWRKSSATGMLFVYSLYGRLRGVLVDLLVRSPVVVIVVIIIIIIVIIWLPDKTIQREIKSFRHWNRICFNDIIKMDWLIDKEAHDVWPLHERSQCSSSS